MRTDLGKTETTVAAVRAGGDLQVVVIRWDGPPPALTKWEVVAFDSDGNPMATMGAFLSEEVAYALLPTLITLAREAYGSDDAREMDDFNLVAWRVRGENGKGWTWAGAEQVNLGRGIGVPNPY